MVEESLPILYSFRRCPYAMRARLALWVSGLRCQLREVELKAKPEQMLLASPKGTVPVLVLPQGPVLQESLDIMRFALARNDPLGWQPGDALQWERQLALIACNDASFKAALDRYKYPQRFGLADNTPYREEGERFLAQLDDWLSSHPALAGAHFGLADAAIAPFVRQWAHTDPVRFSSAAWPALQAWLQAFERGPLFAAVMVKWVPWHPSHPELVWP